MKQQAGFSIVMAIFILVVLSLLGAYMMRLSAVQHTTSSAAVQGVRAYYAAKTGSEWGLAKLVNDNSCVASSNLTIDVFSVIVSCSNQGVSYNEGDLNSNGLDDDDYYVYLIESSASYASFSDADYIFRKIRLTVKK